jgi:RNA polymerase sigma-70 factor (ECF subfamily)
MGRSAAKANLPHEPVDTMEPEEFAERLVAVYRKLWHLAAGITGDRTQADDLVQEAAVVALGKLDQFRPGTNYLAWMAEIVRFQALNHSRKMRNRKTSAMDPSEIDRTLSASAHAAIPPPAQFLAGTSPMEDDRGCFDDALLRALSAVGDVARACLLLRVVDGLSYAEISEVMQVPEGTAMSHVHRAKRQLRNELKSPDHQQHDHQQHDHQQHDHGQMGPGGAP